MKRAALLVVLIVIAGGLPTISLGDTCVSFLNDLQPESGALRPSAKRVYQVLTLLADKPEFQIELEAVQRLLPLAKLRSKKIPEIVGTQNEIMNAVEAADQFVARSKDLQKEFPALSTFNQDLRVILYFRFRDLREVTPDRFGFLKSHHQLRYLELIRRESLKDIDISQEELAAIEINVAHAVREEETLWQDTILEGGYSLKQKPKALEISVYRANQEIIAYRLVITANAVDEEGNRGRIQVVKFYDETMNEIESDQQASFEKN